MLGPRRQPRGRTSAMEGGGDGYRIRPTVFLNLAGARRSNRNGQKCGDHERAEIVAPTGWV